MFYKNRITGAWKKDNKRAGVYCVKLKEQTEEYRETGCYIFDDGDVYPYNNVYHKKYIVTEISGDYQSITQILNVVDFNESLEMIEQLTINENELKIIFRVLDERRNDLALVMKMLCQVEPDIDEVMLFDIINNYHLNPQDFEAAVGLSLTSNRESGIPSLMWLAAKSQVCHFGYTPTGVAVVDNILNCAESVTNKPTSQCILF